jgi:hypothetical protein
MPGGSAAEPPAAEPMPGDARPLVGRHDYAYPVIVRKGLATVVELV